MWTRILAVVLVAALTASCSVPAPKGAPKGTFRPYTIKGKTYHPLKSGHGFSEEGYASWYEPGWFSGKTTANGERLRSSELTCAHKILPMNTMVRVVNLENGREVVLRVNDRGPFVSGRCVDLTEAGAKALGFHGKGVARVSLSTVGGVPGMMEDGRMPGPFYVQVGAFAVRHNAERLAARLADQGYARTRVQEGDQAGQRLWRVQAGQFASMEEALSAQDRFAGEFPDAFVLAQ